MCLNNIVGTNIPGGVSGHNFAVYICPYGCLEPLGGPRGSIIRALMKYAIQKPDHTWCLVLIPHDHGVSGSSAFG